VRKHDDAERPEALAKKRAPVDLEFSRLRPYAKEPSQVYAIRIPVSRLQLLRRLAERRKEQPTALLREWILERLDKELTEHSHVDETAPTLVTQKIAASSTRRKAISKGQRARSPKR
jgi:hypothetical protein